MTAIPETLEHLRVPIDSVRPYEGNARVHDMDLIRGSLRRFGQYRPILVNKGTSTGRVNEILAGNGTWEGAKAEGWSEIAATFVDVPADTAARIVLIDNRSNDLASYDDRLLVELLGSLDGDDLSGTGWADGDLERMIAGLDGGPQVVEDADPDDVPAPPAVRISQPGDVWSLGRHRLICGDAREPDTYDRLLGDAKINVAFTSPPYADRRVYDEGSGFLPVPPDEYVEWFAPVATAIAERLAPDGSWFVNIKPGVTPDGLDTELYVLDLVIAHVRLWGWHFATEFCWERNGVPKEVRRRFKNQFEPVYQFTRGDWKMRPESVQYPSDNVPIAGGPGVGNTRWANAQGGNGPMFGAGMRRQKHGTTKTMSDHQGSPGAPGEFIGPGMANPGNRVPKVANDQQRPTIGPGMAYPGNRLPTFAGSHEATGHTAAFPVGLPGWFIRAYSDADDAIFDPFAGSGSTIIAAHIEDRVGYGIEISPVYCDTICRRFQRTTGIIPVRGGEPVDFDL